MCTILRPDTAPIKSEAEIDPPLVPLHVPLCPPMGHPEPWALTPRQAAEIIGVHEDTVVRYADRELLRCLRLPGGARRFRVSDVEAFIEARTTEAAS